jgi:hypothetical protein
MELYAAAAAASAAAAKVCFLLGFYELCLVLFD